MKTNSFIKAVALVALLAVLTVVLCIQSVLGFTYFAQREKPAWNVPLKTVSDGLSWQNGQYTFTQGAVLDERELWAMLINEQGEVIWQYHKPDTIPQQYTLTQVASFVRWYLKDYPVQTRIREDGLLVVGAPRGSTWKYMFESSAQSMDTLMIWLPCSFVLIIGMITGVSAGILRRWFVREQQARDEVRADWIHGISHDIRTPLSMIMGYADALEQEKALPVQQRKKAEVIRRQSQLIGQLVNDLNLTMRLDYHMQPLRKQKLHPAALLRQAVADSINSGSGIEDSFTLTIEPAVEAITLYADAFLLQRAFMNILSNCMRHHLQGGEICLEARLCQGQFVLSAQNSTDIQDTIRAQEQPIASDGGAAHGTGLKLVHQIAQVHGGTTKSRTEQQMFYFEMVIPYIRKNKNSCNE